MYGCGAKYAFYSSNVRFVYGLCTFCAMMDLPPPASRFQNYYNKISEAITECANKSMLDAVNEAVDLNEGCTDLSVGLDGTWQKRGHTSLHGVVSATNIDTGKVLDVETLTKFCHTCERVKNDKEKLEIHRSSNECNINYQGVNGGMESEGFLSIFNRSLDKYNVRYTKYLGDGDSKSYKRGYTNVNPLKT